MTNPVRPPQILPSCSWNDPGHNPFTGSKYYAILNHPALSFSQAAKLALHVASNPPDDITTTTYDSIYSFNGHSTYAPDISGMYFGPYPHTICTSTDRSKWHPLDGQLAKTWCLPSNKCITVYDICQNVAVITRTYHDTVVSKTHTVPLPSSLYLALIALAIIWLIKRASKNPIHLYLKDK